MLSLLQFSSHQISQHQFSCKTNVWDLYFEMTALKIPHVEKYVSINILLPCLFSRYLASAAGGKHFLVFVALQSQDI